MRLFFVCTLCVAYNLLSLRPNFETTSFQIDATFTEYQIYEINNAAHVWSSINIINKSKNIILNDKESITIIKHDCVIIKLDGRKSGDVFFNTILHQFGYCLGLSRSNVTGSVMNYTQNTQRLQLSVDDILGASYVKRC